MVFDVLPYELAHLKTAWLALSLAIESSRIRAFDLDRRVALHALLVPIEVDEIILEALRVMTVVFIGTRAKVYCFLIDILASAWGNWHARTTGNKTQQSKSARRTWQKSIGRKCCNWKAHTNGQARAVGKRLTQSVSTTWSQRQHNAVRPSDEIRSRKNRTR